MKKPDLVKRAVALNLGSQADLEKKQPAELVELLKENDPDWGKTSAPAGNGDVPEGREDDPRTGKKIKCRIEPSADPDGKQDVFGSVNGYNFYAKRGEEIELDEGFVKHIESVTITDVVAVLRDGKETGEYREVNRPRFNVTKL